MIMRNTSTFSTVATTDTIRDLLRIQGVVVSAYVLCDEKQQLTQWATRPYSFFTPAVLSEQDPQRFSRSAPPSHFDGDEIRQAQEQILTALQTDASNPEVYSIEAYSPAQSKPNHAQGNPDRMQRTSIAIFATPDAVRIVPIPFVVEFAISVGEAPQLSPLLRVFGPEYAVGLRLTNCAAHLTITFPSVRETTPDLSATYTLSVNVDPPIASSQAATLSGMRPLIRWLREVDSEMSAFLPRQDQPVVLLGHPSLCDAFASLNLHRTLLQMSNAGDDLSSETTTREQVTHIRQQASTFRSKQAEADLRVLRRMHAFQPERFCADDHIIAEEAASRRIETLFIDEHLLCQQRQTHTGSPFRADASGDGAVTETSPIVSVHSQMGLLPRIDRTMAETIVAGGTVHAVRSTSLPLGHHIAAIFRY